MNRKTRAEERIEEPLAGPGAMASLDKGAGACAALHHGGRAAG